MTGASFIQSRNLTSAVVFFLIKLFKSCIFFFFFSVFKGYNIVDTVKRLELGIYAYTCMINAHIHPEQYSFGLNNFYNFFFLFSLNLNPNNILINIKQLI